jgi:hypothetical protein
MILIGFKLLEWTNGLGEVEAVDSVINLLRQFWGLNLDSPFAVSAMSV